MAHVGAAPRPAAAVLLLCAASAGAVSMRGSRASLRGWDPICTLGAQGAFGGAVRVFADPRDNSRTLQLQGDGSASSETMVQCKGERPEGCSVPAGLGCAPAGACPCEPDGQLLFAYMRRMASALVPLCNSTKRAGAGFRVLLIGLGGGALPNYVLQHCPAGTAVESVEYDPRVIEVATQFFGVRAQPGSNTLEQGDGGEAVKARAVRGERYDLVLVDAFAAERVPASCSGEGFARDLLAVLRPDGLVMQNIDTKDFGTALQHYQAVFGAEWVSSQSFDFQVGHLISARAPPSW